MLLGFARRLLSQCHKNESVTDWSDGKHPFIRDEEVASFLQDWEKKKEDFRKIDKKVSVALKIFPRVVLEETGGNRSDYIETGRLINQVYNWVINQDFFAETGEVNYKAQAEKASSKIKEYCEKKFGSDFANDLGKIEKTTSNFSIMKKYFGQKLKMELSPLMKR